LHENANHIDNNIKKSSFYYGATFVPLIDDVDEVDEEDEEDEVDKDNNE
jgi:hypothetical protein